MPPRKSDVAKAANEEAATAAGTSTPTKADTHKEKDGINIEDLNLPKSIVTRLAKGVLPPNTQIQGNAILAVTKSATVFVGYLATHANEYAQAANRKTVAPADVLKALDDLEFGEFRPRLEAELEKFNENAAKKKAVAKKSKEKGLKEDETSAPAGADEDDAPKTKKARLEEGASGVEDSIVEEGETVLEDHEEAEEDHEAEEEPEDEVEEDGEEEEQDEEHGSDADDRIANGKDEDEALDNGEDSD